MCRTARKERCIRRLLTVPLLAAVFMAASGGSASPETQLAAQARWLTNHGGVTGTCAGCATLKLRSLSKAIVIETFWPRGVEPTSWALCVVQHESGFNPGAVNSSSGAAGLAQFEIQYHPEFSRWRILHDPAYAATAMFRLSRGGRDRSPWSGGGYSCP